MPAPGRGYVGGDKRGSFMKISYSAVWDDTIRMVRANASLLVAVAGVFLFLPSLLLGTFAPQPTATSSAAAAQLMADYYQRNFVWIVIVGMLTFVGNLSILVLALDETRPTVAGAIGEAFRRLWRYFTVSLLAGIMMLIAFLPSILWFGSTMRAGPNAAGFAGTLALMIPALYLASRLAVTGPLVVAEPQLGSIPVIRRSFVMSRGAGWAILGLIVIVCAVFVIVNLAATLVFGSLFLFADRAADAGGVGAFLLALLQAAIGAAFNVILIVLLASIYRRLVTAPSTSGT